MPATNSFRDLDVCQHSMALVEEIYTISKRFPAEERFGRTSQIRRATVSIPSNIGEGARRKRRQAFLRHLDIALRSQTDRVGRMLNGLIESLQPNEGDRQ